jgi:protein AroM
MITKQVGALLIGQSPRPDLVAPLAELIPEWEIVQAGALDGLTTADLPPTAAADYPLTTRLRDGTAVTVAEQFLTPLLQQKLNELEAQGVAATILLCAGTFTKLRGKRPLLKPFTLARNLLQSGSFQQPGFIVPIPAQEQPVRQRWQAVLGKVPVVWTTDLQHQDEAFLNQLLSQIRRHNLDCLVLDYVGHPQPQVEQLQDATEVPVIDLGGLAINALVALLP